MQPWSPQEVSLIVAEYFQMLSAELAGKAYSKAGHRRGLLPLLNGRSEGSVEFKHQNISAILIGLGLPYIKGYLPRYNYQSLLEEAVIHWLSDNLWIEEAFRRFADEGAAEYEVVDFSDFVTAPPVVGSLKDPVFTPSKKPIHINYLEREQRNRQLGESGERLVLQYERWALAQQGKDSLADQVRWVSKEDGDGAGFDILSRNLNGSDKYIEVKTTQLGKESPFFFTRTELAFSARPGCSPCRGAWIRCAVLAR
jgi:hypothetical protein